MVNLIDHLYNIYVCISLHILQTLSLTQGIQLLTDICRKPEKYKKTIDIDAVDKKVSLKNNIIQLFTPLNI